MFIQQIGLGRKLVWSRSRQSSLRMKSYETVRVRFMWEEMVFRVGWLLRSKHCILN